MSAVKLIRPRLTRSDVPLTLERIRQVAPAVFAEQPWEGMSDSYAYIPTVRVLEAMLDAGFTVYEVGQQRPRNTAKDPYAKHMLRLRYGKAPKKMGEVVPELILVNAHDGTARYYLYAGMYRMICSNGMMVGETYKSMVVAHRGGDITKSRVLEGSYEIVEDEFPKLAGDIQVMQATTLTPKQAHALAARAIALRWHGLQVAVQPAQLLEARRQADEGMDLWRVFNRVQENVVRGGFDTQSFMYSRKSTVREVERVSALVSLNRGLWDAALDFVK